MRILGHPRDVAISLSSGGSGASLGPAPRLVRWLGLVSPLSPSRDGVRELFVREPRMTRLWERFSIDVGIAVERDARFFERRIFERMKEEGHRVLVVEDGDRYAIRAACIFQRQGSVGRILELLHDRTVAGMRGASRVLGLAVRELAREGARTAEAWSFPHSGSFPMLLRHAFLPRTDGRELVVRVGDAVDETFASLASARESWYVSLLDAEAP
ncbi:MAG: hypothetical protein JST00_47770 [Deltaproteobacteria bacterium]|nr:hypothetical protein [Deltaproteobacteria bacterium]